jgi:hypothetical protein
MLAIAAISALLLSGCSAAAVSENAKYLEEVVAITEDTLPEVDLTIVQGYGRETHTIEDAKELLRLMDASCLYAIENGVVQEGGSYVYEGRDAYIVFPREYAAEVSAEYDAHWDPENILGSTLGFAYAGSPLIVEQGYALYDVPNSSEPEIYKAYGLEIYKHPLDGGLGYYAMIIPCEHAILQGAIMYAREIAPERHKNRPMSVVKISENLYQAAMDFGDEEENKEATGRTQFRFKDGLLESVLYFDSADSLTSISVSDTEASPYWSPAYKYTYGMPPVEEQKRFEALLTHRKGLFGDD